MRKTLYDEELLDIVSAANIAGHMEHAGKITLPGDDELLAFIEREMPRYAASVCFADGLNWPTWYDWSETALIREYRCESNPEDAPNILINVSGGLVQNVSCNIPGASCAVYDEDADDYTEEEENEYDRLSHSPGYDWIY